jgi:integrase
MRVGEIQRAQRITLPGGALAFALATTKNGEPRIIPAHPRIRTAAAIPIPPRSKIDYWWPLARQAADLPHVHLHDLRHSAASAMVSAGISLATVGAVLGHKSAASTKRYSHWSTDSLAQAVGMIGKRKA